MKTEYQGRGTPHWHIAARVLAFMLQSLAGRSDGQKSEFVSFLEVVFQAQVDVQYRGFQDDRLASFRSKQEANFLLYRRVRASWDLHA